MNEIILYLAFTNRWLMNELAETEEILELMIEENIRLSDQLQEREGE